MPKLREDPLRALAPRGFLERITRSIPRPEQGAMPANRLRRLINLWPPLSGSGIRISYISSDWSHGVLELRLRWWNRNTHRAAFGGTLFAMTDILFGTMVMQRLGREYEAWTRTGSIDYLRPGRDGSYLNIECSSELIEQLREATRDGRSITTPYTSVIRGRDGSIVAVGQQELYVRRRGRYSAHSSITPAQITLAGHSLVTLSRSLAAMANRNADVDPSIAEREVRTFTDPEDKAVVWLKSIKDKSFLDADMLRVGGVPDSVVTRVLGPFSTNK